MSDKPLNALEVGDEVGFYDSRSWSRAKISRLTPSQMIVNGYRFNRRTGRRVGGPGRSSIFVDVLSEDVIEGIEHHRVTRERNILIQKIRDARLVHLSLEQLQKIWAIIEAEKE